MSSKAAKLRKKGVLIIRKAVATTDWHGFTMQRNHYFGEDNKGYFVSAGVPGNRPGTVVVYRANRSGIDSDQYHWYKTVDFTAYGTGKAIIEAVKAAGGNKVEFKPEAGDYIGSKPHFPTYRNKRAQYSPTPPRPEEAETWVDRRLASHIRAIAASAEICKV